MPTSIFIIYYAIIKYSIYAHGRMLKKKIPEWKKPLEVDLCEVQEKQL